MRSCVLPVEDDPGVRRLLADRLASVRSAGRPSEELANAGKSPVNLLVGAIRVDFVSGSAGEAIG